MATFLSYDGQVDLVHPFVLLLAMLAEFYTFSVSWQINRQVNLPA